MYLLSLLILYGLLGLMQSSSAIPAFLQDGYVGYIIAPMNETNEPPLSLSSPTPKIVPDDYTGYITAPMNSTNSSPDPALLYGHCNIGELYCFNEIVNDMGYPADQLDYQVCREDPKWPGCGTCATSGCKCEYICSHLAFECIGRDRYKMKYVCYNIRQKSGYGHGCARGICY
ncbi:hypothetical protein FB567DRAFT_546177 [Paraphoma chrysanthemicola]|uniref:Secreted protein n=1 Tax=Paraphoma chrysanthemicola TaxID=798071 RepID=A0A8K0RFE0_9PLEO|nr:hypothetical protein FB567DRAFT_546177 [Paraphoma chrysanthemicola]